jgi:hypothetical protein
MNGAARTTDGVEILQGINWDADQGVHCVVLGETLESWWR